MSQITTLLELRKRAESLTHKMHGGSMMVCDAHTLLVCLSELADELIDASDVQGKMGSDYHAGVADAYRLVARRLRGLEAKL
jgi:hypothetical protein